jgi:pilus assembly protein CpaE
VTKRASTLAGPGTRPRILVVGPETQLAERIRAAASSLEPIPEVLARPRLRSGDLASVSGFEVLIVGPSLLDRAGFHRLTALARRAPSTAVVLVIDQRPEATLREIVQVGAVDALPVSVSDDELAVALERVVSLGQRRSGGSAPELPPLPVRGQVITVASPTEGCGKTFVAANTALFLARTGARVVLVDLDLQFGEVRTALRAKADFSIVDALSSEADGDDLEALLPELLVPLPCGFSVLAAPRDPAEADRVGPADVARIIDALRARADYVVVDTPTGLPEHVLPVLDVTDQLLAIGTLDRPSVHNLGVFLRTLDRLGLRSEVALVLNKAELDADSTEAADLPRSLRAVLPYDREVARSINLGVPILDGSPAAPAARELLAFLERLVPAPLPTTSSATTDRSRSLPPVFGGRGQEGVPAAVGPPATEGNWTEAPFGDIDVRTAGEPDTLPETHRLSPGAPPARTGRRRAIDGMWLPPARFRRRPSGGPPRTGPHRRRSAPRGKCRTRAPPVRGRTRPRLHPGVPPDHGACATERGAWRQKGVHHPNCQRLVTVGTEKWHSLAIEHRPPDTDNPYKMRPSGRDFSDLPNAANGRPPPGVVHGVAPVQPDARPRPGRLRDRRGHRDACPPRFR